MTTRTKKKVLKDLSFSYEHLNEDGRKKAKKMILPIVNKKGYISEEKTLEIYEYLRAFREYRANDRQMGDGK